MVVAHGERACTRSSPNGSTWLSPGRSNLNGLNTCSKQARRQGLVEVLPVSGKDFAAGLRMVKNESLWQQVICGWLEARRNHDIHDINLNSHSKALDEHVRGYFISQKGTLNMARLEAQSKLLYYPTPPSVVELIASWFKAEGKPRLVDPCCGKGEALAQFASLVDPEAETWGIEISYSRAQCKPRSCSIPSCLHPSTTCAHPAGGRMAVCRLAFNNPPYDWCSYRRNPQRAETQAAP